MLYRGTDRAALDAAYNNTAAVGQAKRGAYVADRTKRSQTIRNAPGARLDLRYGVGPPTGSTSFRLARRRRPRSSTSTVATGR